MRRYFTFLVVLIMISTAFVGCIHKNSNNSDGYYYTKIDENVRKNIVSSIIKLSPTIDQRWANELSSKIYETSIEYGVDWKIIVSIIKQESNFNCNAKNNRGIGLGQIEPLWAKYYGYRHQDLWDWRFNVEMTTKILAYYKQERGSDGDYWVSAYHSLTPRYRQRYWSKFKQHYKKVIDSEKSLNQMFTV